MRRRVLVDGVVQGAGGVVVRRGAVGPEVAVVHRPRRRDWSFPKGHLEPGEDDETAAVREVAEETGLHVQLLAPLGDVRYRVDGVPKRVRYFLMHCEGGAFAPNDECDELRWCELPSAAALLSHDGDRWLVARLAGEASPLVHLGFT